MNREIKFRLWAVASKVMFWPDEDVCFLEGQPKFPSNTISMQFTGLKDSRDKDIFEGDVCKFTQGGAGTEPGKAIVVFYHGAFHGKLIHEAITTNMDLSFSSAEYEHLVPFADWAPAYNPEKKWIVLGNIYENPELTSNP